MKTWVKLYTSRAYLDHPRLSWKDRGVWVSLLLLAAELDRIGLDGKETGRIDTFENCAWYLRMGLAEFHHCWSNLYNVGLVDLVDGFVSIADYAKYLPDKRDRNVREYKEWRRAIYRRDRFTCRKCGKPGPGLHAHHILAWHDHTEARYDIDNGVTLCECCHRELHRRHHGDLA